MTDPKPLEIHSEKEIFFAALEQVTPEGRNGFLDGACGGNADLRRRVDQLIAEFNLTPHKDYIQRAQASQDRKRPK